MSVVDESVETLDVRYRALVDVAGVLASHVELQDLLHNLRTLLDPLIHFEFLAVYLRDDESNTITLRLREPQRLPSDGPPVSYSLDDSLPGIACRTGKSLYVARVEAGGPPPSDRLIQYNIASACAVPLTTPRRSLGVLTFGSHDENAYTPADIEFMERVGALVAVAVENALSLDTIREQRVALESERDRLGLLLDVTNAVVSELDTRTLFRAVAPALRRCCSADTASLTLYDAEVGRLRRHACDVPASIDLSDLTPVDARELLLGVRQSAAATNASNDVPTPEEIEARQRMWRILLAAVAVLLLAETIFANRGWRGTASRLSIAPSERSTS